MDRLRLRRERPGRGVCDGDADAEDAFLVARREVEVVLPVLGGGVGRPQLLGHPGHVGGLEGDAVVSRGSAGGVQREDVVVVHVVLVAIVVELDVGLPVVRGVDVELSLEDVGGRVRGVDVGDERI